MSAPKKLIAVMTVVLSITPAVSLAQVRGPLPIREETPGLLSQATVSPAHARLAAFGAFPGTQMVAAQIRRQGNRLVYSFDLEYAGRSGTEQVQIDAATSQVVRLVYSVEPDPKLHLVVTAPPELVSLVKSSFAGARNAAEAAVENGRVVRCRLSVEQARTLYLFDMEVDEAGGRQQALIDATTGDMISPGQQP